MIDRSGQRGPEEDIRDLNEGKEGAMGSSGGRAFPGEEMGDAEAQRLVPRSRAAVGPDGEGEAGGGRSRWDLRPP